MRRLIVCADGTWNSDDEKKGHPTNVVKMARAILPVAPDGTAQVVYYHKGVGTGGRLDCAKSQDGLQLSCAWITYLPRPATGRALLSRQSPSQRHLSGTWGLFLAPNGAGTWDMTEAR